LNENPVFEQGLFLTGAWKSGKNMDAVIKNSAGETE